MIFYEAGCFLHPEVVVTSTAKKAYTLTNMVNYKFSLLYRSRNFRIQL